jgi:two-component system chemotaxis response regulator CheY
MPGATGGMFAGHISNGLILVIDDEPDVRKVVRMILMRAGYDVIEAEDGQKAIQLINEGENPLLVDVIIIDIRMPNINGAQAIFYFQLQYPRVPVIVLTGYPDMDMATGFIKKGIVDYLVKPAENEKLLQSVARAIEQRELHSL